MRTSPSPTVAGVWRILLVDDNPEDLAEARRLLLRGSDRRYHFAESATGAAAVRAVLDASAEPPHCMVLDFNLPDMDAPEVLAALAGPDRLPVCPVVVLTGSGRADLGRAVLRAGAQDYIGKDRLTAEGLTRAVENAAERWEMARELREQAATLRASEERFRAIADYTYDWEDWVGPDGRLLWVNPAVERLTGYTPAECMAMPDYPLPIVHPDDRARMGALLASARTGSSGNDVTFRVRRRDGSDELWGAMSWQPLRGPDREPLGYRSSVRDVTERKRVEVELLDRAHRLDLLARTSARLLSTTEPERSLLEGVFGEIGQLLGMEAFYHYRPADEPRLLRLETHGGVSPEEQQTFATMRFGELLCGRVAEWRQRLIVTDLQHSHHPGSEVLAQAGVTSYAGFPLLASGELLGTIAFVSRRRTHFRDRDVQLIQGVCDQVALVLEGRRLDRHLRESEARLRLVLEAADLGLWDSDLRTGRAVWNQRHATLLGVKGDATAASYDLWKERVHADDLPSITAAIEAARVGRTLFSAEHRLVPDAAGDVRWLALAGRFTYDAAGEAVQFSGVSFDITDRKRAEEALRRQTATLQAITDTTPDLIYVKDRDCRLTFANPACLAVLGMTAEQAGGADPEVLSSDPAESSAIRANDERILASGGTETMEERYTGPLGTRIFLSTKTPLRDAAGAVVGLVGISQDITARKRAEADLAWERERLGLALYVGRLGVYEWKVGSEDVWWSPEAYPVFGVDPKSFRPSLAAFTALIHPEDRDALWRKSNDCLARRDVFEHEYRIIRPNGEVRWVYNRSHIAEDPEGPGDRITGVVTDITDRKTAEAEVENSRRLLHAIVEQCPFGIYIVDADFRIASVNAGSQDQAFANVRPLIGRPFDEAMRILWPEPVATECINIFRHTLDTGERYHSANFVNTRADIGQTEGYEWEVHRITLPDGRHGVVCYYFDATRLRQIERDLRESEIRYQLVGEAANDAIWDWDLVTNQVVWNDGLLRRFGYAQGQVDPDASWWIERIHPEDRDRIHRETEAAIKGSAQTWTGEYRFRRADGSYAAVLDRGKIVRDLDRPVRMVGSMFDMTERKQLEDELRHVAAELSEAGRRKDEFLATLSHELRNPLAPIRTGLQVMKLVGNDAQAVEQSRSMMERQLEQMVRLVDDLMDVSRISRGKIELRRQQVPIATLVAHAVETSRPLINQMGHELTITLPKEPIVVDADSTRLSQVFMNLLNNAAKYSNRGGHIGLTVERQGHDVVVSVQDTGIGIDAVHLPHLFELFSQVDRSLEKSQGGLGIGLHLVKRLVEMHDGTIEARSEGMGRGSEFVIRLPIVVEATEPPAEQEKPAAPKSSFHVLVVDDNKDGADSLAMMLKMMGNKTHTAYDGQQGVEVGERERPDVILFDIGLPKLNGYEACRRIRDKEWGKEAILIAITGWGQEEDRRRSNEAGFDQHLVKPVDPTALMKLLGDLHAAKAAAHHDSPT